MQSYETEETCNNCKNNFYWWENGVIAPAGREREEVRCPYCDELLFSRIITGSFYTKKKGK
ncbi:hypothetical protein VNN37_10325 (plasmid) [Lactococcus garvieae]|uniref:hypothetical protein n=1 Tax=Lactococcus garvieae TaxID=1363 RepID=UPI0030D1D5BE